MQQTETDNTVGTSRQTGLVRIAGVALVGAALVAIGTLPRLARVRAAREAVGESIQSEHRLRAVCLGVHQPGRSGDRFGEVYVTRAGTRPVG